MSDQVTFTFNGKPVTVKKGTPVIEAAKQLGISIPHYCYHPALGNPGVCRLCMVEVEGMPKLQVSCRLPAAEGMVVKSSSPNALRAQQSSLEFHLVNHPLDCPVCDQAGECHLQDYYMQIGLYTSAVKEDKLHKEKRKPIGKHVMLDQERCILCTRCTRFTEQVTKTNELGVFNRGDRDRIELSPGKTLDQNAYSGNVVDICPVGALTDRDFRFRARVWYLKSTPSVCNGCSRGCAIDIHVNTRLWHTKGERVARYKPRLNPEVNGYWMCDEGRYSYSQHDKARYGKVRRKHHDGYQQHSWADGLGEIATAIKQNGLERGPGGLAVVLSGRLSNEDFYLARKLFSDELKTDLIRFGPAPEQLGEEDALLRRKEKVPNLAGGAALGFGPRIFDADWEGLAKGVEDGKIWGLWVVDRDPVAVWGEARTKALMSRLALSVYQGPNANAYSAQAQWILPAATFGEEDGTFTNFQGQVQRFHAAMKPLGQSRPDWEIWKDVLAVFGRKVPYVSPRDVFEDIANHEAAFKGLKWDELEPNGKRLAAAS